MGCSEQIEKTQEVDDIVDDIVEEPEQKPQAEDIAKAEIVCLDYDGNKEECLLYSECKWTSEENICEPIDIVEEEEDVSTSTFPVDVELDNDQSCQKFDNNKEVCLSHRECKWSSDLNGCNSVDTVDEDEETFESALEEGLPDTIPNGICKNFL